MSNQLPSTPNVGDRLGPLELDAISRLTLALYCGGSNDHYGIHVDADYARSVGLDDVIGHGMLSMAYVGRLLTSWAPQERLRSFDCRFVGTTQPGDVPVLNGEVVEIVSRAKEQCARIVLTMANQHGDVKVTAEATVALPAGH